MEVVERNEKGKNWSAALDNELDARCGTMTCNEMKKGDDHRVSCRARSRGTSVLANYFELGRMKPIRVLVFTLVCLKSET
jgi:hypothetical protein